MYHQYAKGGKFENENAEMLKNQVQNLLHHSNELSELMSNSMDVEPWVITKAQRAVTDLADITHYLEGEREVTKKFAEGGQMTLFGYADGGRMQTKPKFYIEDSNGDTFYLHFDAKNERTEIRFDKDPNRIYMYDSREEADAVKAKLEQYGYSGLSVMSNVKEHGGMMAKGGNVSIGKPITFGELKVGETYFQVTSPYLGIEKIKIIEKNGNRAYTYVSDRNSIETYASKYKGSYSDGEQLYGIYVNKEDAKQKAIELLKERMSEYADGGIMAKGGETKNEGLYLQLQAYGNPDYVFSDPLSNIEIRPYRVSVKNIQDAVSKVQDFINEHELGSGNFPNAGLYDGKNLIGYISYNGQAWNNDGTPMMADGGMMDEDDEYGTFEMMKRGGKVEVEVVNQGENFDENRYEWMLEDFDKDGVPNADDSSPLNKRDANKVDNPGLSKAMTYLLDLKGKMDDNMYSFIDDLKDIAPDGSKIYARTKTPYSILNKLVTKRLMHPKNGLTDLIGTTITTLSKEELDAVRDEINSGELGKVIEFEDMYEKPKQGYRAYHFLVERNGMPIEVQLKTKRQKAINQISHEAYKEGRLDGEKLLHISAVADKADLGDAEAIKEYQEFMSQPDVKQAFYMEKGGKMAKGGIAYPSLSDEKPMIVQDSKQKKKAEGTEYLPEIKIILENDDRLPADKAITSSLDAYNSFWRIWDKDSINVNENMYVLFLKQNNKPKGYSFHSKGAISATMIDPAIIAGQALKSLSKGIIIAHNHPSGSIEPSLADKEMANKLREGLKLFGINMLDSLILTPTYLKYRSMEEEGDLNVSTRKWAKGGEMAKGGKTPFRKLAMAIAKKYEGKPVKPEWQEKYGKRYDKDEAMKVGNATAAVIERRKGMM